MANTRFSDHDSSHVVAGASLTEARSERRISAEAKRPRDANEEASLAFVASWIQRRTGLAPSERKRDMLAARLSRVCDHCELKGTCNDSGRLSLGQLAQRLATGVCPEVERAVIDVSSTNHSYFFREPEVLEFFRQECLRKLAAPCVRVWSAAASTGDEAYTLAMLAAEALGRTDAARHVEVLGTDLCDSVLERAATGIYGERNLAHCPVPIREKYFVAAGIGQLRVAADIRAMCTFRRLNLQAENYPFRRAFHVIFARNVFYYWDRKAQRSVLDRLYQVAEPGAFLFTSVTEPVRDLGSAWEYVCAGVCRRAT